ncbi:hypothetical protein TKK_0017551 [Trichogramma kaykai]
MEAERKAIIDALSEPKIKNFAFGLNIKYEIKNAEESVKARKEGNNLYIKKNHSDQDHKMILYFYNKSIAYAPSGSEELMYAYSNRAYFLILINKYNEALDSLDKAIQLTDSTKMKLKLYCQKAKCLAALGSSIKNDVLREIDQIFKISKLSVEDTNFVLNIIRKTKAAVASMKQFKPNNQQFLQEKEQYNKIINDREKVDPFDFVEIKLTENMGRGLFAKTNFKAGDLVLVEKPCLIGPHFSNQYVFCSQCLSVAWTGIPCETCHDYIFCSLKCKTMAWKEYHFIDCSITPYLILCDRHIPELIHMNLKFVISLMKDYKTIDELKYKLNIPKNDQVEIVNDKPELKINLLNKLMSLSHNLPMHRNFIPIMFTVKALICMVKYTSFFSEKLKDMQCEDFSKNEDFLFIGSLLLRLAKISIVNSHTISSDIIEESSSQLHDLLPEMGIIRRGFCVGLISSMINHSCAPNIRRCFTDDMKYVFYATEPIASGTQLLDSYNDYFYETPLRGRRLKNSNFVCQCIACSKDWPLFMSSEVNDAFLNYQMKFKPLMYLRESNFIMRIHPLKDGIYNAKYSIDKNLIQTVTNMMDEIADVLPQPSLARCMLFQMLVKIFNKYYGHIVPFENLC